MPNLGACYYASTYQPTSKIETQIVHPQNPQCFPEAALPPELSNLIYEVGGKVKTPLPLIWCTVACALAATYQGKVKLERKPGYLVPLNIFTNTIGESGIGKTPAEDMLFQPFKDFEAFSAMQMAEPVLDWKADEIIWNEEKKFLTSEIARRLNDGDDVDDMKEALKSHLKNRRSAPPTIRMFFRDATAQAVVMSLKQHSSILYSAGEGGLIKPLIAEAAIVNTLWDGSDYQRDRVSSDSFVVKNPRLSISLQIQPKTFQRLLERQGYLGRDNGMWARFLFCAVDNPAGTRIEGLDTTPVSNYLEEFRGRLLEVLKSGVRSATGEIGDMRTIALSEDAQFADVRFCNRMQNEMNLGGHFSDVKDAATKISTNVCKVAGLFHCYSGNEGPVSADTFNRAAALCEWHLLEFKRIFSVNPEVPREIRDPQELGDFLARWALEKGVGFIQKGDLLAYGPNSLRGVRRMDAALRLLSAQNVVIVHRMKNAIWVVMNPQVFPGIPPMGNGSLPPYFHLRQLPRDWRSSSQI